MISTSVPGCLELIGNHTDYNEGHVLAFAINLGITIHGKKQKDNVVTLKSAELEEETFTLKDIVRRPHAPWANCCKGVILQLQQADAPLGGFHAEIHSTLPTNTEMGSNAAIEIATLLLLQKLFNFEFGNMNDLGTQMAIARICQAAEIDFVGNKCGILNHAIPLVGKKNHVVFMDCRSQETEILPLRPETCFVVCHSGVKHMLLSSKYNARWNECNEAVRILQMNKIQIQALCELSSEDIRNNSNIFPPRIFQRAMHVTTENERVLEAKKALLRSDMSTLGQLMFGSHESSRQAFENSTPFLDQLVEIARSLPSCIGSRLTGSGFGGSTLNLVYQKDVEAFITELTKQYRKQSGKEPRTWVVKASDKVQ